MVNMLQLLTLYTIGVWSIFRTRCLPFLRVPRPFKLGVNRLKMHLIESKPFEGFGRVANPTLPGHYSSLCVGTTQEGLRRLKQVSRRAVLCKWAEL